jgi:uncharacterized YigZ family protein
MFDDTYKTIAAPAKGSYSEKRSKFLAYAFPVQTEEQVKERLSEIQKKHNDARHCCYAYILGPNKDAYRMNDNGEPSGTAGRPIHGQLLSKDLTDTLVVVVRYFGGIKLGVSGLQNAYKVAARDALDSAVIIEKAITINYEITFDYIQMNAVMQWMKEPFITILSQDSNLKCTIKFSVRRSEADHTTTALRKLGAVKAC